jgi:transposase
MASEAQTLMISITNEIGIDVHKATLQVSIDSAKSFCVANDQSGIGVLLPQIPKGATVHIEASGGYERPLRRILKKEGITCKVHNPRKIERLADALSRPAKTDNLDAILLCEAGPLVKGYEARSLEQEKLNDMSRAIESLKVSRSEFKKQAGKPELPSCCAKAYAASIKHLDTEIKKLEKAFFQCIQKSSYKGQFELAKSVNCIGPITAAILVSEFPANFYNATPRQLVSYGSLAPKDDSSGKRNGQKHLGAGNMHIKGVMYMPAMTALKTEIWAKALYKRLLQRGRCHQQAIVAVMRKLLERVIVVIQRGTAYQAVPPKKVADSK